MTFENLSDGKKDGFGIMYVKDGTIYPVVLNQSQAEMLDLSLSMVFADGQAHILNQPMGKATPLVK